MSDSSQSQRRYGVLVPVPVDRGKSGGLYDYLADQPLGPGDIVEVPFAGRTLAGVVWGKGEGNVAASRLKRIRRRYDIPPFDKDMRGFIDWVADYTLAPKGAVLKMALSAPKALEPPQPVTAYVRAEALPPKEILITPARGAVLSVAGDGKPRIAAELAREAGVSPSVITGLFKAGYLEQVTLADSPAGGGPDPDGEGPPLTPEQEGAAQDLREKAGAGFSVTLLDGVPGAGKTEVYFEAVADTLHLGHQVLVLLPEIALSAQWLKRFAERFGAEPHVWHSDLGEAKRRETWRAVGDGSARVVVGARSALFLPFSTLGLVVLDEEHDSSYKQEEQVIYNARDMAIVRAQITDCPIILASATPSLETVVNGERGRYARLHLPNRHGGASLPDREAIDMRAENLRADKWLSEKLRYEMLENLRNGEQSLLFLNRRGYAPLTLCRVCGHRFQCPNCTAWLVEHKRRRVLECHHCGHYVPAPEECPTCHNEDSLAACGPGVERLEEEVRTAAPGARIAVATSDSLTRPSEMALLVEKIENHDVDILIGTQIVTKGYHFPLLTLVGVVDADLGLAGGDLRGAERTFQLLYQVAGRAGRADKHGRVLFQTYMPDHPVMAALVAGDRDAFIEAEKTAREAAGMPPFGRLVALIVSGGDENAVVETARALSRAAPNYQDVDILGPAPAPLAVLRGRYRYRFLLKAPRSVDVQAVTRAWLDAVKVPSHVRVQVDVDPYSFL